MIDATPTAPTRYPRITAYRVFVPASTDTISFIRELDSLLTLENYNGFTLQASTYAYRNARHYLESASNVMKIPHPEFTPDGEGGIDIEWEINGRRLALSCKARDNHDDFISWREAGGRYEGDIASEGLLKERLDWLTR
jgi:hypothetical protein